MVLFFLQEALGNQYRQINVLVPGFLEAAVHFSLDVLPDCVAIGPVDEHTLDGGIVNQLRLFADVRIPLGEIYVPRGNGVHLSLIFRHNDSSFSQSIHTGVLPPARNSNYIIVSYPRVPCQA